MERIKVAIEGAPPVWTERDDVGDQLANAIGDIAGAPKGGVFSCRWAPKDRTVYWSYQWLRDNGCREALIGMVTTHNKHVPCREILVENQDRYGLPECHSGWEDRAQMAWVTSRYEL